ncbi:hypothetical protein ACF0H5_003622 [Mactra antiquata]
MATVYETTERSPIFPSGHMELKIAGNNSNTTIDADAILWRLNAEKIILLLPVIIFVVVTVIVGIVGNSLVCYIYTYRLRRSPSRYFILFLALLDLISCIVGAGSEISDLLQPYVFSATWSCKILRSGLSFTIISASFTLICVAFDRYYKVCKPLKAFPVKKVKILCVMVTILSIVLSSPALAIFGLKSVETDYEGVVGHECSTNDAIRKTAVPIIYYVILFTAFLILLISFVLLYVRIGVEIWKRKKLTIGETLPELIRNIHTKRSTKFSVTESGPTDEPSSPSLHDEDNSESRGGCDNAFVSETDTCMNSVRRANTISCTSDVEMRTTRVRPKLKRRRSNLGRMSVRTLRTTSIFFAVSAAFVLSFLPYLIANILKFTKTAFYDFNSSTEEVIYNFCVRSYFISNCINPIIYSALNANFRKECKKLLKRMFRRLKLLCLCKKE